MSVIQSVLVNLARQLPGLLSLSFPGPGCGAKTLHAGIYPSSATFAFNTSLVGGDFGKFAFNVLLVGLHVRAG